MWSFFSRDPLKDLPFELGERITTPGLEDKSLWSLHDGKRKVGLGQLLQMFLMINIINK